MDDNRGYPHDKKPAEGVPVRGGACTVPHGLQPAA